MTEAGSATQPLRGRRLLVGVCGGIAAYKACYLVSRLVQDGAEVRVVMTPSAARFVGPASFRSLTNQPVATDMWEALPESTPHIALSQFAELAVVVPATANTLAKVAHGVCDNLLTATIAATEAPVLFAPAMNQAMWDNPITQSNVARLQALGYHFVMPEAGHLACGDEGRGRLAEPETIRQALIDILCPAQASPLAGKKVLITAGPTREWLDPVRFLSNPASGRMGLALAGAAAARGAQVLLVLGPTHLEAPTGIETIEVEKAQEMYQEVIDHLPGTEVFIGAAAVADYRPEAEAQQKQKKTGEPKDLHLVPTPDILKEVAASAHRPAVVVGFAAETEDLESQAQAKLESKDLDLIVANDLSRPGTGFAVDTNEVLILDRRGEREFLSRRPKTEIAARIMSQIEQLLAEATT